jgi:hypothetical protein
MIFARVYRTQTCILPIEYLVGHEGQPLQQVCLNTVLHCRGHKGLRLLIESYPPSVKVYPQVERHQIFFITIIIIINIINIIILAQ